MMKNKNVILIAIICFAFVSESQAQEFKQELSGIKKIKISMSGSSDLKIYGGKTNNMVIKSMYEDEEKEGKEGLKAIYPSGFDNTDLGLSVSENDGVLTITKLKVLSDDDYIFNLPSNIPLSIHCMLGGNIYVRGFDSEIEVQTLSGDINIIDVTGPILANATIGDISVKFNDVAQESPMSIVALTGDISLEMPKNTKANLVMETMTGTAYSDLEIKLVKDKSKKEEKREKIAKKERESDGRHGHDHDNDFNFDFSKHLLNLHNKIKATLNGGGVEILAKSLSGDVVIRERK